MSNLTFNAIDVETVNQDPSSICQIGICSMRNGTFKAQMSMLVDLEAEPNVFNGNLHGMTLRRREAVRFCLVSSSGSAAAVGFRRVASMPR